MIHQLYVGCHYCGTPIPANDDHAEGDTMFCSQVCFIRRVVYDMLVAFKNKEARKEKSKKKHYGFRLTKGEDDD
jgi:hypothetical protein